MDSEAGITGYAEEHLDRSHKLFLVEKPTPWVKRNKNNVDLLLKSP